MIKLEQVNKYFNKRKKNEIHVINNTSLEMEQTGLVALLGPSGCGKTTLLNAIGGLDKVNGRRSLSTVKRSPADGRGRWIRSETSMWAISSKLQPGGQHRRFSIM